MATIADELKIKTAAALLQRAGSSRTFLSAQALQEQLGSDGYKLALELRWLAPDYDSGTVNLTANPALYGELIEAASQAQSEPPQKLEAHNEFSHRLFAKMNVHEATTTGFPADQDLDVSSKVVVAGEGQTYDAVVQARHGDGTYTLSFGNKKPTDAARRYKREELKSGDDESVAPESVTPGFQA